MKRPPFWLITCSIVEVVVLIILAIMLLDQLNETPPQVNINLDPLFKKYEEQETTIKQHEQALEHDEYEYNKQAQFMWERCSCIEYDEIENDDLGPVTKGQICSEGDEPMEYPFND